MKSKKLWSTAAVLLGAIGVSVVSVASMVWFNQPKVPQELLK